MFDDDEDEGQSSFMFTDNKTPESISDIDERLWDDIIHNSMHSDWKLEGGSKEKTAAAWILLDLLKIGDHYGKEKAIITTIIGDRIHYVKYKRDGTLRREKQVCVTVLSLTLFLTMRGYPVCGLTGGKVDNKGIFLPLNKSEMLEYHKTLGNQIRGIQKRRDSLAKCEPWRIG